MPGHATTASTVIIEIVRNPADQVGFAVHPRRWVVERSVAWLGRNRRPSKDDDRLPETGEMLLCIALSRILLRRLTVQHER